MRLHVLSIVLLTRSLSHHRHYAQGGQPRRRRYCGKSQPDRHGRREGGGKLDDSTLTVAHSDSWSMTTFAVPESEWDQCGSAAFDPALEVAGGRLGLGGAVARSQKCKHRESVLCPQCSVPERKETSE